MGRRIYKNKGNKENIVISIAGAHGVGKTTVFTLFKKEFQDNNKFKFFPERYIKTPPFPFGSSDKQIGFRSEIHFLQQLIRRNKNITNFINKYNGRIIILDRTPLCILVYSKSLNLKERDYNLILDTYNSIQWKEDYVFYLYATPDTIMKRIIQRGSLDNVRREWNEYEKDYLMKIISYYKQFLSKQKPVFMIDTDELNPKQVIDKIKTLITNLTNYSFMKLKIAPTSQMNINKFL